MSKVVYLIRHPDKESDDADARITPLGHTQVRHIIPRLKELHVDIVVCSKLARSIELANQIGVQNMDRVRPVMQVKLFDEIPKLPCVAGIDRKDPAYGERMLEWSDAFDTDALEPGEGYLTRRQLEERVQEMLAFLERIPYDNVAAVGHAHSIAACVQWTLLGSLVGFYKLDGALKLDTASITTLIREQDRRSPREMWKVQAVNDTAHLDYGINTEFNRILSKLDKAPVLH